MARQLRFVLGSLGLAVGVGCGDSVSGDGDAVGDSTTATSAATPAQGGSTDDDGDRTSGTAGVAETTGAADDDAADGPADTGTGDTATGGGEADCTPFPSVDDFGAPGPFETVSNAEGPDCTIFRPAVLGAEDRLHPIILWGNGTTAVPAFYAAILSHWASHGFIVAAANTSNAGTGVEMLACLDYLEAESTTNGSVYDSVVDLQHVGTSGHSQGGGGSIMAGRDPRVTATAPVEAYTEQGFGGYDQSSQSQQTGPMFLISGSADTTATPVPNQQRVWDTVNVPVLWGTKLGANHILSAIGAMPGFRPEITAWMRYQLMCDDAAAEVFVGACTICGDATWETQSMGL